MSKWRRKRSLPKRWNRNRLLDKFGGCCGLCKKAFEKMKDVTIDHIIPLSKGGPDVFENMQPAHEQCNQMKRDMSPEEFREYQSQFK